MRQHEASVRLAQVNEALAAAPEHGSVTGLEAATGLRTSSLYLAFGDKAGLFRRALDHYVASVVAPRLASYAGQDATLDDLERLFLTRFEPPFDDGHGCLVVNSAAEFGSTDSIARDGVRRGLGLVHQHWRRCYGASSRPVRRRRTLPG